MLIRNWPTLVLAGGLALGLSACANDEPYDERAAADVSAPAAFDYGRYDNDIDTFLDDYMQDDEMFADDNLDYTVNQGVVTVTGELDSQEELSALQTRIRRVPGVRDLNVGAVRIAGAS